jgi:hypothetical protein
MKMKQQVNYYTIFLYFLGDYKTACQKLRLAVETSNIESAAEDSQPLANRSSRRAQISSRAVAAVANADHSSSSSDEGTPQYQTSGALTPPSLPFLQSQSGKQVIAIRVFRICYFLSEYHILQLFDMI